jgi:hypothetical protein
MKIIMRHGEATPCTRLTNGNVAHLIQPSAFEDLIQKGCLIREKFNTQPDIFTSSADRSIETALLITPQGKERVLTARTKIEEMMRRLNINNRGGQWYDLLKIPLPDYIKVEKDLLKVIPSSVKEKSDVIIVTHSNVIETIGLKLNPGEFLEIS